MEYTQDALFFTAEEVVAQTTKALNEAYADADLRLQRAKDNLSESIAEALVSVLKTFTQNGDIDKSTAQEIYDAMKYKCGWSDANLMVNTYEVTVTLNGDFIAEVSDIEAEDEDEACDLVRDDFILYDATANLTFRHNGNDYDYEVNNIEHELSEYQDGLEFVACEQ
jgi:hypothetical protein